MTIDPDLDSEQQEFLSNHENHENGFTVKAELGSDLDRSVVEIQRDTDTPDLSLIYRTLDTGWSWVVLFATFMSFVVLGGSVYTTGIDHTILLERFNESNATTAWAASLFSALSSLAGPLSSFLIDRYSCRVAVITSGILLAVGFVGTAFAPTIHLAIVTFGIIAGLGVGCGYIAIFTTPGFNFHRKLNMAMGLANSGAGLGIFIVGPMTEIARETYGTSGCFFILAAFALHNVVFGALMRPSALEHAAHKLRRTRNSISVAPLLVYLKVCMNKCVICLSLSMFCFSIGSFSIFIHLPNYSIYKGFTSLQASFLISISGFMTIICRILTGTAANDEGVDELYIYVGSMWIQSAVTFLLPTFGGWYAGQVVFAGIIGLYFGCCYVLLPTINKKTVGVENMASALGIEYFIAGLGSIIGPVLAGCILDQAGSYDLVFTISAIFLLLGANFGLFSVMFTTQGKKQTVSKPQEKTWQSSVKVAMIHNGHPTVSKMNEKTWESSERVGLMQNGHVTVGKMNEETWKSSERISLMQNGHLPESKVNEVTWKSSERVGSVQNGHVTVNKMNEETWQSSERVGLKQNSYLPVGKTKEQIWKSSERLSLMKNGYPPVIKTKEKT